MMRSDISPSRSSIDFIGTSQLTTKITDERHPVIPESQSAVRAAHSVHRIVRKHHKPLCANFGPATDSWAAKSPDGAGYHGSSCARFVAGIGNPFASPVTHGPQQTKCRSLGR